MRVVVITAATGLCAAACGPSVQLIYEGNLRFEHCYRLDLDEKISPTHRQACWSEWLRYSAKGQTRDRLEYAKRRVEAIRSGNGASLPLQLSDGSDAGVIALAGDPAPIPTSAHAPPPPVLQNLPIEPVGTEPLDGSQEPPAEVVPETSPKSPAKRLKDSKPKKAPTPLMPAEPVPSHKKAI